MVGNSFLFKIVENFILFCNYILGLPRSEGIDTNISNLLSLELGSRFIDGIEMNISIHCELWSKNQRKNVVHNLLMVIYQQNQCQEEEKKEEVKMEIDSAENEETKQNESEPILSFKFFRILGLMIEKCGESLLEMYIKSKKTYLTEQIEVEEEDKEEETKEIIIPRQKSYENIEEPKLSEGFCGFSSSSSKTDLEERERSLYKKIRKIIKDKNLQNYNALEEGVDWNELICSFEILFGTSFCSQIMKLSQIDQPHSSEVILQKGENQKDSGFYENPIAFRSTLDSNQKKSDEFETVAKFLVQIFSICELFHNYQHVKINTIQEKKANLSELKQGGLYHTKRVYDFLNKLSFRTQILKHIFDLFNSHAFNPTKICQFYSNSLQLFCRVFSHSLIIIDDLEFQGKKQAKTHFHFDISQLQQICFFLNEVLSIRLQYFRWPFSFSLRKKSMRNLIFFVF